MLALVFPVRQVMQQPFVRVSRGKTAFVAGAYRVHRQARDNAAGIAAAHVLHLLRLQYFFIFFHGDFLLSPVWFTTHKASVCVYAKDPGNGSSADVPGSSFSVSGSSRV